jgi:predicted O-methyltransferase YrrM
MPLSPTLPTEEQLLRLERELETSRANEQASKGALHQLHRDLNAAYLKIARQDQKLDSLVRKLRSRADGGDESSGMVQDETVSRLADLANPHNFCRALVHESPYEAARPSIRQLATSPEAVSRIDALWQALPKWATGVISTEDAGFLDGLIHAERPDQVYEVGVASGASSALILRSMADYADAARIWLHSYDIASECYFDPSHQVGDATRTMVPELLEHWKLNVRTTALDVPRCKEGKSLYFIDANHSHPWPAFDLIALLPGLKAGDVVALHDVNLPTITAGKFPDYGAQWLFTDWLGERLQPAVAVPNIGAVVIPENKQVVLTSLIKTLSRPWPLHVKVEEEHLLACEKAFQEFLPESTTA